MARSEHFALHRSRLPSGVHGGAGNTASDVVETAVPCAKSQPVFPILDLWIGAMVPKRWAKRAVTRNAIKRQIYAVSADFSPKQRQAAFVVRLRRDFSRKVYLSASSDLLRQAVRAELFMLMQVGSGQSSSDCRK